MIDPTKKECAALDDAVVAAGEYIESIGKGAAFAGFDADQFDQLVEVVVTAYQSGLQRQAQAEWDASLRMSWLSDDDIPF